MKILKIGILLLVLSKLSACAVMGKKECFNADWQQVGYSVALEGDVNVSNAFRKRQKACSQYGVNANLSEFKQGHADGTVAYCQPSNAVELGVQGKRQVLESHLCPEHDYPGFSDAFSNGYKLYLLRRDLQASASRVSNLENIIYRNRQQIRHINQLLSADDIKDKQRNHLRYQRRSLRDQIYQAGREISYQNNRLRQISSEAEYYENYLYDDYVFSLDGLYIDPRQSAE